VGASLSRDEAKPRYRRVPRSSFSLTDIRNFLEALGFETTTFCGHVEFSIRPDGSPAGSRDLTRRLCRVRTMRDARIATGHPVV
jgi:hypothetical protein